MSAAAMVPSSPALHSASSVFHLKDYFAPCPTDERPLNLRSLVVVLGENLKYALTGVEGVRDFP